MTGSESSVALSAESLSLTIDDVYHKMDEESFFEHVRDPIVASIRVPFQNEYQTLRI